MCPIIKYEPTLCDVNADGEILVSGATAFVSIILGEEAIPVTRERHRHQRSHHRGVTLEQKLSHNKL